MTMPMGNGCVNGSPNVGTGNYVRYINPSGNVNNNNANNNHKEPVLSKDAIAELSLSLLL